jgi:hypothetical protein
VGTTQEAKKCHLKPKYYHVINPKGLTLMTQPLDACMNQSFKAVLEE